MRLAAMLFLLAFGSDYCNNFGEAKLFAATPKNDDPVAPANAPADDWRLFRGNALQNGVVDTKLPDKLELLWKFPSPNPKFGSIEGSAAIVDGVVYVGSFDEFLYAIDLKTGKPKWSVKLGPIKSSPCVKGGKVYVGDADGKFFCVDAANGKEIWRFVTGGEIAAGCSFAGDKILVGSHDETLYCLDDKGAQVWTFKTQGPVNGSPAVIGNKTFVAGCDSLLHVVDIAKGEELFNVDLGGQAGATAAVRGDSVYVGTMNNQFMGIDLGTKQISWTFEAQKRKQPFYSSAAVTDDIVVVGNRDRKVYALDRKKGTSVWEWSTDGRVDSSPVIVGNRVFVGSLDKTLYVLDLKKGAKLQDFELDSGILASPAAAEGCIVIGSEKGTIYCFGAK
jgi:outer membrane protein assembly factor BamB